MSDPNFIHLRLHSEYSIVDGIVRLDDAVKQAVNYQMGALALTDLSNLFGLIKFYSLARKEGIKPIAGADIWVTNPGDPNRPFRCLLLVKNHLGYLNLCELLTKASLENQVLGRPEVQFDWFSLKSTSTLHKDQDHLLSEGLICLSGAMDGDIGQALLADQIELADRFAASWSQLFTDSFYLEVQRTGHPKEEKYIHLVADLANRLDLPIIATHPIEFMHEQDFTAHEIRVCIADNEKLGNPKRQVRFTREQYFKSPTQMVEIFHDIPSAIENTIEVAKRCNLTLQLGKPKLPDFPTPDNSSLSDYLALLAKQGLQKRLETLYPNQSERESVYHKYADRLHFEINTIVQMGFPGYFLIVADFIAWAKNNGVPVGPGRGSGAGSLVAYSLGITDLDPLQYNLLFERFLNPERVSMPDFDIDFCQLGRDRVIQYVKDKYGNESVSQIATFGTMAAKGAIKDVGRAIDQPFLFVDSISKLIDAKPGQQITIAEAVKDNPALADLYQNNEEAKDLIELAQQLEGITRNVGMHAGGVLISPGKLTDFCPLNLQSSGEEGSGVISQFDKDDVEAVGLVKFDFLGLTTLTILDLAEKYIQKLYPQLADWHVSQVPLDDPLAFDILKAANTVAIFQLESRGMQGMLKEAKPDRFEDIIALVALYRPGPMDLIPSYIARKHLRQEVEYADPRVIPVLQETYGIMVYQEQVMQMAQVIGGYSLGGADLLRRAMGKKKPEEMAEHSKIFAKGAIENGLTQEKADEIFKLMEAFAGYGFNKSHAAAYALLAYHTAWLKAHYPAEFMAANLSMAMADTEKVRVLVEDAKANQLVILPPDVNQGEYRFVPMRENPQDVMQKAFQIRYGLGAIKGTGENAVLDIIRARQEKPFAHLFDFCKRVDRRIVNRRTIEAMIRAGAFDAIAPNGIHGRSILLESLPNAMAAAEQALASINQVSLFAMPGEDEHSEPEYVPTAQWMEKTRLQEEKAVLGFCMSGHLFDAYANEVRKIARVPLNKLSLTAGEKLVAGVITYHRTNKTSKGVMNQIGIDDGTAQIELTVFDEVFEMYKECFREDELLIAKVQTKVQPANENFAGNTRHIVHSAMNIASARLRYAQSAHFKLNTKIDVRKFNEKSETFFRQVNSTRTNKPKNSPEGLVLTAQLTIQGGVCELEFPPTWKLYPDDSTIQGFNNLLHQLGIRSNVSIQYESSPN